MFPFVAIAKSVATNGLFQYQRTPEHRKQHLQGSNGSLDWQVASQKLSRVFAINRILSLSTRPPAIYSVAGLPRLDDAIFLS
jgi:hypothetical protein